MEAIGRHEVLRGLSVGIFHFRAISCEHFHDSLSTAAIMASSFEGVRTVRVRPAFTRAVDITLLSLLDPARIFETH
jgi:hypothetical protein